MRKRAEEEKGKYHFVISRAVTAFPAFVALCSSKIEIPSQGHTDNGIIYLKGGDLEEELGKYRNKVEIKNISDYFSEDFFETKKIIYLSV
jgi:16S rRNA (guanine527-N7)-methyltransferase